MSASSEGTPSHQMGASEIQAIQGGGDDGLTDVSRRLESIDLIMEEETLISGWDRNEPMKTEATATGGSEVGSESKICNSQITSTGGDVNLNTLAYHVSGNFVQVTQATPKESNKEAPNTRRNDINEEDNVAAGMLVPAPPPCILERDAQHGQIVEKLLSIPNARVAILGMGGIGKTTLACSVANDHDIIEAYPRRLFLSFEGCSTPDLAYTNLATAFQRPTDRRSSHRQILSQVLTYLRQGKCLFIIDNFETFWEVSTNRRAAEDFLAQLAALPKLAIIVTLRGIQRPGNMDWVKIEPLETLTPHASKELLSILTEEEYTAEDLEYIRKLLHAVAGIPLAVTLIRSLLRDKSETPKSLWYQWTRESALAIRVANEIDSDDRLYKLDISLRLSVFGPRMSDNAKEVLAAISILPIGLNMDEAWLDDFQSILPATVRIRDCIRTLRDVALVVIDSSTTPHRLRLLPPVRDFCLDNLPLDREIARRLIDKYNTDLRKHRDWGSNEHYTWATTELDNIAATLNHSITLRYVTDDFGPAIYEYMEWRRLFCIPETDTVQRAIDILSEHPKAKAKCLQGFGVTLGMFGHEAAAIRPLEQALSICKGLGNKLEVGWTLYFLSGVHFRLEEYNQVVHYLREALEDICTELNDRRLKGSVLQMLADTYLCQNKLSESECTAKQALELAFASGNRKGEVIGLGTLGDIYRIQGKYELAVEKLTSSCNASQDTNDTREEARANELLGLLYRDFNELYEAAMHFQLAEYLYERAQRPKLAKNIRAHLQELEISQNNRYKMDSPP